MNRAFYVVAIILGALVLVAVACVFAIAAMMHGEGRADVAGTQIKDLESALVLYDRDCGSYPTTAQGMKALVENPGTCPRWRGYLAKNHVPPDPWGNPYRYFYPGTHGHEMEIISAGPDGKLDTEDDVVSWSLDENGNVR